MTDTPDTPSVETSNVRQMPGTTKVPPQPTVPNAVALLRTLIERVDHLRVELRHVRDDVRSLAEEAEVIRRAQASQTHSLYWLTQHARGGVDHADHLASLIRARPIKSP